MWSAATWRHFQCRQEWIERLDSSTCTTWGWASRTWRRSQAGGPSAAGCSGRRSAGSTWSWPVEGVAQQASASPTSNCGGRKETSSATHCVLWGVNALESQWWEVLSSTCWNNQGVAEVDLALQQGSVYVPRQVAFVRDQSAKLDLLQASKKNKQKNPTKNYMHSIVLSTMTTKVAVNMAGLNRLFRKKEEEEGNNKWLSPIVVWIC